MPPHWEDYQSWLNDGMHGEMGYLERHRNAKRHPENLLPDCKTVVAVALNYRPLGPRAADANQAKGHIATYAWGRDYHRVIHKKLRALQAQIVRLRPETRGVICVDSKPLMERDFAALAGLGWFGKNTMIINSHRGSWFLLGFLLLDVELPADTPASGGCGTCTKCIDACPTGAIVERDGRWSVDARRCISYATIEKKGPPIPEMEHGWLFGCDVCQDVCPFNHPNEKQPLRAVPTEEPAFRELHRLATLSLDQMASLSYKQWEAISPGSPLRRAGYSNLIRRAKLLNPKPESAQTATESKETY